MKFTERVSSSQQAMCQIVCNSETEQQSPATLAGWSCSLVPEHRHVDVVE